VRPIAAAARRFFPLSSLLLLTGLVLLAPTALRVAGLVQVIAPRLVNGLGAGETVAIDAATMPDPSAPEAVAWVEPAAGPAESPEARHPAAPVEGPSPLRAEALAALAAELERRQAALADRERAMILREAAVRLVEEHLAEAVAALEKGKAELELQTDTISREDAARTAQLVKVYEAMKARSAATIFETMELAILLPIVQAMRDTKVAAIIAEMTPEKARMLTAELAKRRGGTGGR
jgi:flagellar motility protein MotE (MotC chaperone)